MTRFFNNNPHLVYVDLPSQDAELTRIRPYEEYEASGADADVLDVTPGVVNLSTASDEVQEQIKTTLSERELLAGSSYPDPAAPSATPQADPDLANVPDASSVDLADKSLTELRKLARGKVKGFSKMKKPALLKALQASSGSSSDDSSGGGGTITSDKVPGKGS